MFNRGDGQDVINDYNVNNYGGADKILLGAGILREHVTVSRTGDHIVLAIADLPESPMIRSPLIRLYQQQLQDGRSGVCGWHGANCCAVARH